MKTIPDAGMSLRDWFAGQALAGALAASERFGGPASYDLARLAHGAYTAADAMLAERAK